MLAAGEIVLPFPAPREQITPARKWRSTWILSSIQTLRERGHFDRYVALLPAAHRDAILFAVAGVWLPLELARVHYDTCHALGLPRDEIFAMGLATGRRGQGTVLATAARIARGVGATPWTIVPQVQRLWERGADGGANEVRRLAPNESLIETVGCSLLDVAYFRTGYGALLCSIVRLFAPNATVDDITARTARGASLFRFRWE